MSQEQSNTKNYWAWLAMLLFCCQAVGCNLGAQQNNIVGQQAFQNGNNLQALARFQQALSRNPNNPDANYNLVSTDNIQKHTVDLRRC